MHPDLTGLRATYRVHLGRALPWLFVGTSVLIVPSIVLGVTEDPSGSNVVHFLVEAVGYALLCVFHLRRPHTVFVLQDGLVWQGPFRRRTTAPWSDVRAVCLRSRWRESSVLLTDGRRLPLVAVPASDVEVLKRALAAR